MRFLAEHPAIRTGLILVSLLSVWGFWQSCQEGQQQSEWLAADRAWEERDTAFQERMAADHAELRDILTRCGD